MHFLFRRVQVPYNFVFPCSKSLRSPAKTPLGWAFPLVTGNAEAHISAPAGPCILRQQNMARRKGRGGNHVSGGQGAGAPKISGSQASANSLWQGGWRRTHSVKGGLPK